MLLKYVAGQLLCQSVAGLTKGFRTKAFPVSGKPFGTDWGDGEKTNTDGSAELLEKRALADSPKA